MRMDLARAQAGILEHVARPLGLGLEAAAHGIVQIANANMSRAIRSVSVERGYDLSRFALCAFGGAGPLHALEVAAECGIPAVLVPREPGTLCARGMLLSDLSADYVRSRFGEATGEAWAWYLDAFEQMTAEGNAWLDREACPAERRRFRRVVDARYRGQNFEIRTSADDLGAEDLDALLARFHAAHRREYGYALTDRAVELVSCRVQAIGLIPRPPPAPVVSGISLRAAELGRRQVWIDARHGWQEAPVLARARLPLHQTLLGPAIIAEMSATTLVLPNWSAVVDSEGNLVLRRHA
jgi:N-methylhydantoinase A